jgi:iron-sulfur cluster assembly accessory protein
VLPFEAVTESWVACYPPARSIIPQKEISVVHYKQSYSLRRDFGMIQLTETAVTKVSEILKMQDPKPAGLRIAVVGGGCSGFSYSMAFENQPNMLDKTYDFGDLKVFVDQASMLYLDGAEVDYVETLEGSGFKFNNPHVKSTCGCGSSFNA